MKIVRLQIEQQMAQIKIDQQRAQLHVEMPKQQMQLRQAAPEMNVQREEGSVELDLGELKSNLGLKSFDELNSQAAAKAQAKATEGIKDIVKTADYLGDPTIQGPKIGEIAKRKMLEVKEPEMNWSPVPPGEIKMDGIPGTLEIDWTSPEFSIDWLGECIPEIYVEPPYSIEVSLENRPYVKVSVTMESIPDPSGRNVNSEI